MFASRQTGVLKVKVLLLCYGIIILIILALALFAFLCVGLPKSQEFVLTILHHNLLQLHLYTNLLLTGSSDNSALVLVLVPAEVLSLHM